MSLSYRFLYDRETVRTFYIIEGFYMTETFVMKELKNCVSPKYYFPVFKACYSMKLR